MAIHRHARRASRRRAITVLTTALVAALLVAPATAATAAVVASPSPTAATVSAPAALTSTPVLAAVSSSAAKRKWQRRRRAVRFARRQLGKPYRWGGSGPGSYDCSGLTLASWKRGGKSLPHSSRMQSSGTRRIGSRKKMRIGDLLFYGNPVHHVAIYVGNGKMIEAPGRGKRVRKVSAHRAGLRKIGRP
jgi:cell wall-associated NlpC family hydrolase